MIYFVMRTKSKFSDNFGLINFYSAHSAPRTRNMKNEKITAEVQERLQILVLFPSLNQKGIAEEHLLQD